MRLICLYVRVQGLFVGADVRAFGRAFFGWGDWRALGTPREMDPQLESGQKLREQFCTDAVAPASASSPDSSHQVQCKGLYVLGELRTL